MFLCEERIHFTVAGFLRNRNFPRNESANRITESDDDRAKGSPLNVREGCFEGVNFDSARFPLFCRSSRTSISRRNLIDSLHFILHSEKSIGTTLAFDC